MRMSDGLKWAVLTVLVAGCGSDRRVAGPNPLEQDFLAIVSDPAPLSSASFDVADADASLVAYVSLTPGTVPNAQSARIRNLRNGAVVVVPIVAGGFDPIAVPAEPGDVLEITVVSGPVTLKAAVTVLVRRRPIVVRTDPPPQKLDVPLNASIVVVFSEPIDPGTLSANTIQLDHAGLSVAGILALVPGKPSTVVFTPAALLDPGTTYDLIVTQGIRDLTGDQLDAAVQVRFTTVADGVVPDGSAQIAFVSNRDGSDAIYVTNSDGSGVTRLAAGSSPAWSRDGRRIAFVRGGVFGSESQGIYVMNADGSGLRFLAGGFYPSWSPDGSKIVFNGPVGVEDGGIFVMNADGSGIHKLIGYEFALPDGGYGPGWVGLSAWSPDGRSIAFVRANYGVSWAIYLMNTDGTTPRPLNLGYTVGASRFTWSPDGSRLLVQLNGWHIISADTVGGHLRYHTSGTYVGGPDWSPDGRSILFEKFTGPGDEVSAIGSRMRIFTVGVEGSLEHQLIPDAISPARSNYWDHEAAWARTGYWDYLRAWSRDK